LHEGRLPSEAVLHQMIKAAPELLSPDWMLIGSELPAYGGRLDLLAIAPDGSLVLIELKRDRTPREVVAQALDYASWVEKQQPGDVAAIYRTYSEGGDLAAAFGARFGRPLVDEDLNSGHAIVIVASELDPASERIVEYLAERDVPINVLFFRIFDTDGGQLISRAWLVDPVETPAASAGPSRSGRKEAWNGEYYVSYGEDSSQTWAEARTYGFITASGGAWYTRTLQLLSPGDRIWVNIPATGYAGVGVVDGPMQTLAEFTIPVDGEEKPAADVLTQGTYGREFADDEEKGAYFVPVRWLQTVPRERAVREPGFFGNQNTVAAPRTPSWSTTVDRLKVAFPAYDDASRPQL
jgi:hypothetical protein